LTESHGARPSSNKRRALILVAGLGVLLYTVAALSTDADKLRMALSQLGWLGSGLVLGLSLVNYLFRFQRWRLYIAELGHRLPTGQHLLYYLSGFAFTVSPAKAGEAVRSLYLREHGVSYPESIAALFVERLLDLLAMALLASLIVLDQLQYWPVLAAAIAVTVGLLLLIGQPALPRWTGRLSARRSGRLSAALAHLTKLLQSSQNLLRPQLLIVGLVLGVIAWGAEGIGFQLICRGLQFDLSPAAATGIYAIAALGGGAAFFMPGGIGGMEVVMTSLLVARGMPLSVAIIATLLCHLATLWFAVVIGLITAAILEAQVKTRPIRSLP